MEPLTLAVVAAGLGRPSSTRLLADRLAEAVQRLLADSGRTVLVEAVELRELAVDIANTMVAGFPGPALRSAIATVTGADAVIAVSPVFTASYSGLFKSFFDVIEDDSLIGKPLLVAATGGTARHSLALEFALRPLFAYLRAQVAPTAVFAATEDWGRSDEDESARGGSRLGDRIERAAGELAGMLLRQAPVTAAPSGRDDAVVVPFAQQLAALGH